MALIDRSEIVNETCEDIVKEGLDGIAIEADLEKYADAIGSCTGGQALWSYRYPDQQCWRCDMGQPFVHYEENKSAEIRRSRFHDVVLSRGATHHV